MSGTIFGSPQGRGQMVHATPQVQSGLKEEGLSVRKGWAQQSTLAHSTGDDSLVSEPADHLAGPTGAEY